MSLLPHPIVGRAFTSPVLPGSGWPDDVATPTTPVAHDSREVAEIASSCSDLADLDAAVTVCRACDRLVRWREDVAITKRAAFRDQPYWGRPAASFGDTRAPILIVGLAPAAHGANRTGRMFTGDRSGDWLYAALHRAGYASQPTSVAAGDGLTLRGVRMVPAAHCAPPQNRLEPAEREACSGWLLREFELLEPGLEAILALGAVAWDAILSAVRRRGWQVPKPKPRFGHAAVVELATASGRTVRLVGCYHPSQQNTFTGRLTESMLDTAIAHLRGPLT